MNTNHIHIALNIDDNYLVQCCTMLTSIFENNKDAKFAIYILYISLSETSKHAVTQVVKDKYGHQIIFLEIDGKVIEKFPISNGSHISASTYIRLFIAEMLPTTLDKVIYLDCDLIIESELAELWNTDISHVALACVEDMWSGRMFNYERLRYPAADSYFNAGVLLVNLEHWRQIDTGRLAIDCINEYGELRFYDQDILNILFHNNKKWLPLRWNIQDGFMKRKLQVRREILNNVVKERSKKGIIHFTGSKKPWTYKCRSPFKNRYFYYLDMTQWKGLRPHTPFMFKVKTLVDIVLTKLHLKSGKHSYVTVS